MDVPAEQPCWDEHEDVRGLPDQQQWIQAECTEHLCARCGGLILPGEAWDLDHTDDGTGYLGPSHARCNRATAGKQKARLGRIW